MTYKSYITLAIVFLLGCYAASHNPIANVSAQEDAQTEEPTLSETDAGGTATATASNSLVPPRFVMAVLQPSADFDEGAVVIADSETGEIFVVAHSPGLEPFTGSEWQAVAVRSNDAE